MNFYGHFTVGAFGKKSSQVRIRKKIIPRHGTIRAKWEEKKLHTENNKNFQITKEIIKGKKSDIIVLYSVTYSSAHSFLGKFMGKGNVAKKML